MTENKKRGRPPKDDAKNVMLSARFKQSEADEIAMAIGKSGRAKTDWIQNALLSSARHVNRHT